VELHEQKYNAWKERLGTYLYMSCRAVYACVRDARVYVGACMHTCLQIRMLFVCVCMCVYVCVCVCVCPRT
jgi:hypothetical protein